MQAINGKVQKQPSHMQQTWDRVIKSTYKNVTTLECL